MTDSVPRFSAPLNHELRPTLQWVEVASSLQIPSFHIVGLPSQEVSEARERIRAAIESSGLEFPRRRIVLNLSPASVKKQGTGLDLAMALAVLTAHLGEKESRRISSHFICCSAWGELGLDGRIKAAGQLTRAIHAAWESGVTSLILARDEISEARARLELLKQAALFSSPPPTLLSAATLKEAWERLLSGEALPLSSISKGSAAPSDTRRFESLLPLSPSMERALGVAASGMHHLLLLGPRGTGKSHALEWFISLQPASSPDLRVSQALLTELSCPQAAIAPLPPVRRIGLHARPAALMGTADPAAVHPGEFSLAHGGVLVADELPEWPRDTREILREPLERGTITVNRARGSVELPARFLLAANGNFCPCGGWPREIPLPTHADSSHATACRCPQAARAKYLARLSGPIVDRIDLLVRTLSPPREGESASSGSWEKARRKVEVARERAVKAYGKPAGLLTGPELEDLLAKNPSWRGELAKTASASLRSRHKILRLALSLGAWDERDGPAPSHFMEASCYRPERAGLI